MPKVSDTVRSLLVCKKFLNVPDAHGLDWYILQIPKNIQLFCFRIYLLDQSPIFPIHTFQYNALLSFHPYHAVSLSKPFLYLAKALSLAPLCTTQTLGYPLLFASPSAPLP